MISRTYRNYGQRGVVYRDLYEALFGKLSDVSCQEGGLSRPQTIDYNIRGSHTLYKLLGMYIYI